MKPLRQPRDDSDRLAYIAVIILLVLVWLAIGLSHPGHVPPCHDGELELDRGRGNVPLCHEGRDKGQGTSNV